MIKFSTSKFLTISIIFLLQQSLVCSECSCENEVQDSNHKVSEALKYKIIAMATVLVSSLIGVCIPIFAKKLSYLNPENDFYFLIKAFAAGVVLATGFIHILPDAFEALSSPCIGEKPWKLFPFSSFVTMVTAIGTLIMEALIMGYKKRSEVKKSQPLDENDESHRADDTSHVHNITLASDKLDSTNRLRYIIVSQILELGIVLHSIILGISLGVSRSSKTIKPLVAVLTIHQFFEGIGLGGCISQAQFKYSKVAIMILFFCLIFPIGIGIGIGISDIYNENSPKALIVEGLLLSASAGVLINMALVDLVAADFLNSKMLTSLRLQLGASLALFIGLICMSILALMEHS
ncbi:unnamed protein product [Vicia faba]|uniref:Uncharacterized protein n=1 Tax=Vicia faba TaxID=3906 RepID=A0AAV0Z792_VICFA|nr:unnamed protein product [Vicia faba]